MLTYCEGNVEWVVKGGNYDNYSFWPVIDMRLPQLYLLSFWLLCGCTYILTVSFLLSSHDFIKNLLVVINFTIFLKFLIMQFLPNSNIQNYKTFYLESENSNSLSKKNKVGKIIVFISNFITEI